MTDTERAREYFSNDRYAVATTGIEIIEAKENYAKCSLKIDDRHKNALGYVMGGVMYTMADFVFAVSTNLYGAPTVTAVSQISYTAPPKGDTLIGESRLIKDGKRSCFFEIKIFDNFGTLVAVIMTNGTHLKA